MTLCPFRRCLYGPNVIDVPVKSCISLLFEEVGFKRIWNLHVHHCVFDESLKMHFTPKSLLFFSGMSYSSILYASLGTQPILHFPVGQHHPMDY